MEFNSENKWKLLKLQTWEGISAKPESIVEEPNNEATRENRSRLSGRGWLRIPRKKVTQKNNCMDTGIEFYISTSRYWSTDWKGEGMHVLDRNGPKYWKFQGQASSITNGDQEIPPIQTNYAYLRRLCPKKNSPFWTVYYTKEYNTIQYKGNRKKKESPNNSLQI